VIVPARVDAALPLYAVFLIGYLRNGLAPLLQMQDEFRLLSGQ
jgi:hypothetical protein